MKVSLNESVWYIKIQAFLGAFKDVTVLIEVMKELLAVYKKILRIHKLRKPL